jgi:alkanesulfonate monooxygenase SsuD/methylene tetrahydromethanopterin reductase-like flavin-dependent oxidoreductase (luciferase family)
MKFGFLSEGDTPAGLSYYHRYWELVDEVIHAEKMGFDWFGTSEQHVTVGGASVSSPEILYSYLIARTSRIRFRHASTLTATRINHPLRIAERVATEDILSHGRIELGLARGNSTAQLRAFEVELDETRPQLEEALDLIRTVFTERPFTFKGEYYDIPPRFLVPTAVQRPHPPMFLAATSDESHAFAGREGLGLMSNSNFAGFENQRQMINVYDEAISERAAAGLHCNRSVGTLIFVAHCAETREQAYAEAQPILREYLPSVVSSLANLAKYSESYAYMGKVAQRVEEIVASTTSGEAAIQELIETATMVIGDPDDCIAQIERFKEIGVDDMILRLDTVPHKQLMNSIELFGKYVIPHFKDPDSVAQSMDENVSAIRARREERNASAAEGAA